MFKQASLSHHNKSKSFSTNKTLQRTGDVAIITTKDMERIFANAKNVSRKEEEVNKQMMEFKNEQKMANSTARKERILEIEKERIRNQPMSDFDKENLEKKEILKRKVNNLNKLLGTSSNRIRI